MKKTIIPIIVLSSLLITTFAYAVPVLQVGAPGTGSSTYAPYGSLTSPAEDKTALTDGNKLFVAGTYQQNDVINLGGLFNYGTGIADWSNTNAPGNMVIPTAFNGHGAVLLATYSIDSDPVTNASLSISLDNGVNYFNQFLSSSNLTFPNNHAPLQDGTVSGYYYFDIGNFLKINNTVPNFDPTDTADLTTKPGEIKTILFTETGLNWIHFDVMAIEVSQGIQGGGPNAHLVTTWDLENNPASHDVTWKDGGGGGREVPEPGTIALVGAGLVGLVLYRRKARS